MSRSTTLFATAAILIGLVAAPAIADDPVEFTDVVVFDDLDPCTGEIQTITIEAFVSLHDHPDEFIARLRRTGDTSAGYIMKHGKEIFVGTETTETGWFDDPWRNPDNGNRFAAQGRFLLVDGEVLVDDFRLVCTSGPTIDPS